MSEFGDHLDLDSDPVPSQRNWGLILIAVAVVGLIGAAIAVGRSKKNEEAREAVVRILDQELDGQQEALKIQRGKLDDLTHRVETMRSAIQLGDYKDGKAAVAEYNQLAAQQRAEREKYTQMAGEYNQKVAKLHELSQ